MAARMYRYARRYVQSSEQMRRLQKRVRQIHSSTLVLERCTRYVTFSSLLSVLFPSFFDYEVWHVLLIGGQAGLAPS